METLIKIKCIKDNTIYWRIKDSDYYLSENRKELYLFIPHNDDEIEAEIKKINSFNDLPKINLFDFNKMINELTQEGTIWTDKKDILTENIIKMFMEKDLNSDMILYPDITENNFTSWIADEYPYAIIYEAARSVFKTIGADEETTQMAAMLKEQWEALWASNILTTAY